MPPGQQFHLQKRVAGPGAGHPVFQPRLLGFGPRSVERLGAVGPAVAEDIVAQFAALGFGPVLGQRPIDLADAPLANHFVEPHQRLGGLGEKHCPAHRAVDAVHHAEKHLAGLAVALLDEAFYPVLQRTLARGVGLHQIAAVLVDYQQVVVFIKNIVGREHGATR